MEAADKLFDDNSYVTINVLIDSIVSGQPKEGVKVQEGGLRLATVVEAVDYEKDQHGQNQLMMVEMFTMHQARGK